MVCSQRFWVAGNGMVGPIGAAAPKAPAWARPPWPGVQESRLTDFVTVRGCRVARRWTAFQSAISARMLKAMTDVLVPASAMPCRAGPGRRPPGAPGDAMFYGQAAACGRAMRDLTGHHRWKGSR
ncbi:hypothetical protein KNE206_67720 [Kitasatospora sp. NE20-6]